jgi:hypothetical protein
MSIVLRSRLREIEGLGAGSGLGGLRGRPRAGATTLAKAHSNHLVDTSTGYEYLVLEHVIKYLFTHANNQERVETTSVQVL